MAIDNKTGNNRTENVRNSEPTVRGVPENGASAAPRGPRTAVVMPRPTGPRTRQGKEQSKYNALKHGIFSEVVVLKGESQAKFDALLTGLRNSFAPEGTLEEVLVEKLAALLWRNRRLLIAEGAEIRAGAEFLESDGQERQRQEVAKLPQLRGNGGLMRWLANPEALQGCLYLLNILRESIERIGFDPDWDKKNLTTLYGEHHKETLWRETLFNRYLIWLTISLSSEEEPQEKGTTSPQQCKDMFLAELVAEIKRLERYEQEQATVVSDKLKLESLCSNVPDAQQLDRLLRYETTLERGIDRVLNQIERLQRMRLGQPVAPSLNVNVSSS